MGVKTAVQPISEESFAGSPPLWQSGLLGVVALGLLARAPLSPGAFAGAAVVCLLVLLIRQGRATGVRVTPEGLWLRPFGRRPVRVSWTDITGAAGQGDRLHLEAGLRRPTLRVRDAALLAARIGAVVAARGPKPRHTATVDDVLRWLRLGEGEALVCEVPWDRTWWALPGQVGRCLVPLVLAEALPGAMLWFSVSGLLWEVRVVLPGGGGVSGVLGSLLLVALALFASLLVLGFALEVPATPQRGSKLVVGPTGLSLRAAGVRRELGWDEVLAVTRHAGTPAGFRYVGGEYQPPPEATDAAEVLRAIARVLEHRDAGCALPARTVPAVVARGLSRAELPVALDRGLSREP